MIMLLNSTFINYFAIDKIKFSTSKIGMLLANNSEILNG